MGLTDNYNVLTLVLVSSLAVLAAVWISFYSLRRYEIAVALILLSPWAGCSYPTAASSITMRSSHFDDWSPNDAERSRCRR